MARFLVNQADRASSGLNNVLPVKLGGTGSGNRTEAISIMNWIAKESLTPNGSIAYLDTQGKITPNQIPTGPNALVLLNQYGRIPSNSIPKIPKNAVHINGPASIGTGQQATYEITNYDDFSFYNVGVSDGEVSINRHIITITAGVAAGNITLNVNGDLFSITVTRTGVNKPTIIYPANGATNVDHSVTIACSSFSFTGVSQTQTSTRWEISTLSDFSTLVDNYEGNQTNRRTAWPTPILNTNTKYYVRVKHQGSVTGWSEWSDVISFTVVNTEYVPPTTPPPSSSSSNWAARLEVSTTANINALYNFNGIVHAPDGTAIYAVGSCKRSTSSENSDALITKWSITGNLLWEKNIGAGNTDVFTRIAISADGVSIYACGYRTPDSSNSGLYDNFITKWDAAGNLVWQKIITQGTSAEAFYDIAISGDNSSIYLTGMGRGILGSTVIRIDTAGNVVWQKTLTGQINSNFNGYYMVGDTYVSFTSEGYTYSHGICVDSGNNIYSVGAHGPDPNSSFYFGIIAKWNSNGGLVWQNRITNNDKTAYLLSVSSNGNSVYAVGYIYENNRVDALITKWSSSGGLVWKKSVRNAAFDKILISNDGSHIYAVGLANGAGFITKWDAGGNLLWERAITSSASQTRFHDIAANSNTSKIYCAGYTTYGSKYSPFLVQLSSDISYTSATLTGSGMTGFSLTTPNSVIESPTILFSVGNHIVGTLTAIPTTTTLPVSTPSTVRYYSSF